MQSDISSSMIATCIAEILTLPICTVKTIYQNSNSKSFSMVARNIYRKDGIRGFFRASLPAVSSQVISTSSKYTFYRYLDRKTEGKHKIFNGIISGITSSLMTHPMDFVRIHWQMNESMKGKFIYQGYSKTLSKVVLGSMLFLPLYDTINQKLENPVLSSFGTAVIATTIMHPIDHLKTRRIYGLSGFNGGIYKGLSLNLMRIVPHFTITMTIIEYLRNI